jgi:hypothetical protein
MRDDDEKYLDPRFNPFLPQDEPERKSSPEPDLRAPFVIVPAGEADAISQRLRAAFPGLVRGSLQGHEVELEGEVKIDGRPIAECPAHVLSELERAIREKGGI